MSSIISAATRVSSPEDVQGVLSMLEYRRPDPEELSSALVTLGTGKANCYEAGFAAAHLMSMPRLGFKPRLLFLGMPLPEEGPRTGHAVYMFEDDDGYKALGRSSIPELEARLEGFATVGDLAASYSDDFAANGYELAAYGVVELEGNMWRVSREPLGVWTKQLAGSAEYIDL